VRRAASNASPILQVTAECGDIAMAMVQNKCDLLGPDGVAAEAAEAVARRLRLRFYRTCVREGHNCDAGARPGRAGLLTRRARAARAACGPGVACRDLRILFAPSVRERPRFTAGLHQTAQP